MTRYTAEAVKDQLLENFNAVVAEAEQLLKVVANEGGDQAKALRAKIEQNLTVAKKRLRALEENAVEKTRAAARATDQYVHENPWRIIGVAAGLGVVIGLLMNRR
jgi:ElaB/YqjD/DUF883 family membrane-anchored ribosome-binding protein